MTKIVPYSMWLNPLPGETVIGAIVGAVLSTVMAQFGYFKVNVWLESGPPLVFTFLILSFGVSLHFHCAAMARKPVISCFAFIVCSLILVSVLFMKPKDPFHTVGGGIRFEPGHGAVLMAGVMLIWLVALIVLTIFKYNTEVGE